MAVAVGAAILTMASACAGAQQSTLSPAGTAAAPIAEMGVFALVVSCAAAAITIALLFVAALKRRGTLDEHAPYDEGGGHLFIWIGGIAIPVVVLCAFFIVTLVGMRASPLHASEEHTPEIVVVGHQYWWEVHYPGRVPDETIVTANEIHIPVGQPVEIELQSRDVIHSFWVPRLHGKVDLIPGQLNRIRIEADSPGVYEGQCAEMCGPDHALMRLLVVADPPDAFALWLAHAREPAQAPPDDQARRGQQLFETTACALCHTIGGTRAHGLVGPNLTHIGSRMRLASDTLPNDRAHLEAWIARAQSFKPGAAMPNLTEFDGEELRALTHYLETLR